MFNKFRRTLSKRSAASAAKSAREARKKKSLSFKIKLGSRKNASSLKKHNLDDPRPTVNSEHLNQINIEFNKKQEETQMKPKNDNRKIVKMNENDGLNLSSYKKEDISVSARKISRLTVTLMLLSFPIVYFFTYMPMFVLSKLQIAHALNYTIRTATNGSSSFGSQYAIVRLIMFSSNSLNILVLFTVGKSFRQDVLNLFKKASTTKPIITYKNMPCIEHLVKNVLPQIETQVTAKTQLTVEIENEEKKSESLIKFEKDSITSWPELVMRDKRKRSISFCYGVKHVKTKTSDKEKNSVTCEEKKNRKLPSSFSFGKWEKTTSF